MVQAPVSWPLEDRLCPRPLDLPHFLNESGHICEPWGWAQGGHTLLSVRYEVRNHVYSV